MNALQSLARPDSGHGRCSAVSFQDWNESKESRGGEASHPNPTSCVNYRRILKLFDQEQRDLQASIDRSLKSHLKSENS